MNARPVHHVAKFGAVLCLLLFNSAIVSAQKQDMAKFIRVVALAEQLEQSLVDVISEGGLPAFIRSSQYMYGAEQALRGVTAALSDVRRRQADLEDPEVMTQVWTATVRASEQANDARVSLVEIITQWREEEARDRAKAEEEARRAGLEERRLEREERRREREEEQEYERERERQRAAQNDRTMEIVSQGIQDFGDMVQRESAKQRAAVDGFQALKRQQEDARRIREQERRDEALRLQEQYRKNQEAAAARRRKDAERRRTEEEERRQSAQEHQRQRVVEQQALRDRKMQERQRQELARREQEDQKRSAKEETRRLKQLAWDQEQEAKRQQHQQQQRSEHLAQEQSRRCASSCQDYSGSMCGGECVCCMPPGWARFSTRNQVPRGGSVTQGGVVLRWQAVQNGTSMCIKPGRGGAVDSPKFRIHAIVKNTSQYEMSAGVTAHMASDAGGESESVHLSGRSALPPGDERSFTGTVTCLGGAPQEIGFDLHVYRVLPLCRLPGDSEKTFCRRAGR